MDTKAVWDAESTEIFINACIEQIYQKERQGLSFTKKGWQNILSTFNEKTAKQYDKKQLKNRLDILRKDLKCWDALLKETGVGRDPVTNNVVASSDWWHQKIRENAGYKKFRHSCLKNERELRIIFKDVMATGDHIFSPSFTQPQPNEQDEDDVYRPMMDEEEGSGDSEDELFGANPVVSTGVTAELASIGITRTTTSDTNPTLSALQRKRKRGEGTSKSKKQKVPASTRIADAVSVIADASKDRSAVLTANQETSIQEVMSHLLSLDEVKRDKDFGVRCIQALESKTRRETFVSLKKDPEYLMAWLHFIVDQNYLHSPFIAVHLT